MPRPLYLREGPCTHLIDAGVGSRVSLDRCGKSRPTGIRSLDRQDLARRYTNWAISVQLNIRQPCKLQDKKSAIWYPTCGIICLIYTLLYHTQTSRHVVKFVLTQKVYPEIRSRTTFKYEHMFIAAPLQQDMWHTRLVTTANIKNI
jgi:hypothetical protein